MGKVFFWIQDQDYLLQGGGSMEVEHEEYKGHHIELRPGGVGELHAGGVTNLHAEEDGHETKPVLLIDGAQVDYDQLPDGKYFIHENAYYWTDNLMELGRKIIDYRINTGKSGR